MLAQALACRARPELTSVEQRFEAFRRIEDETSPLPDRARATRIGLAYEAAFKPEQESGSLISVNDRDLDSVSGGWDGSNLYARPRNST